MRVIGVRTDRAVYPSNVYGGGTVTITATVRVDPMESGMYKLQAYIKKDGEPANTWQKAGYEQWGTPRTSCITGVPGVKSMCGDDVQITIPSPVGFGKHVVTAINITEMKDVSGETLDGVVRTTGAYAMFEVLPMDSPSYGLLKIISNPSGATIVVDGIDSGKTTPAGTSENFALPAGTHSVTLSKMGYRTFRQDVVVVPREAVQVFAKMTPGTASGTGALFAIYGSAYAAWGDDYNLIPEGPQPPNPLYKPAPSIPLYAPASMPNIQYTGRPFAVTSEDPLQVALSSLGDVGSKIATYTPYIALGIGGLILVYALSKPTIRKKATEYAARGGVATRAGLGGARDVARAAYRGFKEGRVEGATPEEMEYMIQEARAKREHPSEEIEIPQRVIERAREAPFPEAMDRYTLPMEEKRMTWLNGDRQLRNGVKRAKKITLMMEE